MTPRKPTLTQRVASLEETQEAWQSGANEAKTVAQDPEDAARWRAKQAQIEAVNSAQRTTQTVILAQIRLELAKATPSTNRVANLSTAFNAIAASTY